MAKKIGEGGTGPHPRDPVRPNPALASGPSTPEEIAGLASDAVRANPSLRTTHGLRGHLLWRWGLLLWSAEMLLGRKKVDAILSRVLFSEQGDR